MTTKEEYNRVKNLQIICDALRQEMDIDVSINKVIFYQSGEMED